MDYAKESLKMHYELKGKIEIKSRAAVDSKEAFKPCLHTGSCHSPAWRSRKIRARVLT